MKTISPSLAILFAVVLSGCQTTTELSTKRDFTGRDYSGRPTVEYTVTLSGTPGLPFEGKLTSDGQVTPVVGTIPATFYATTHELTAAFKKTAASGLIEVRVAVAGKGRGTSSTADRYGGVRAQLICTPTLEMAMFTTF